MGYYVDIQSCYSPNDIVIKESNYEAAYKALCELNTNPEYDVIKGGGSYGGDIDKGQSRPDNLNYHPARWFSWMAADYHDKCKTLQEVLQMIGFDVSEKEGVGITFLGYSNKTGDEDKFLCVLAPFIENGVEIVWIGEDGERWKNRFKNGKMYFHKSKVMYETEGKVVSMKSHIIEAKREQKLWNSLSAKLQDTNN